MSKSQRLRAADVANVHRLIGDCRDLGADAAAWQRRLLEGLMQLTGARVAYLVGLFGFPGPDARPAETIQLGLDGPRQTTLFGEHFEYMFRGGEDALLSAFMALPADRLQTYSHVELIDVDQWQRSESFQRYHRAMDMEPGILSMCPLQLRGGPYQHTITVRRCLGERAFSSRDVQLIGYLHQELATQIGRSLATADEPSASELPPRLQETLRGLLDGHSEKEIAEQMEISRATVHEYVTALYRRFGVNSRSELVARWIRYGTGRGTTVDA